MGQIRMQSHIMLVLLGLSGQVLGDHQDETAGNHHDETAGNHHDETAGNHHDEAAGINQMFLEMRKAMIELNKRVVAAEQKLLETKKVEKEISRLRDGTYYHECAYAEEIAVRDQPITYDRIFYYHFNVGSGIDIATGTFTSPFPGTYTVSYTVSAENDNGANTQIIPRQGSHAPFELSKMLHET